MSTCQNDMANNHTVQSSELDQYETQPLREASQKKRDLQFQLSKTHPLLLQYKNM